MTDVQRVHARSNGISGYNPLCLACHRTTFVLLFSFLLRDRSDALSSSTLTNNGHSYYVQLSTSNKESSGLRPPLVILPGFAQSISTFQSHVPSLSRGRHVLIFQPCGLGPEDHHPKINLADLPSGKRPFVNVSLPAQADRLLQTIDLVFPDDDEVDVAAFSLGARVALCAALRYPRRVRRLHLTGVSLQPSVFAKASFHAWKCMLRNDNLEGVAWSSLLGSYSPAFLVAQESRLATWVSQVCDSQTCEGLLALLEQAYPDDADSWSVSSMALKVTKEELELPPILLCVGSEDLIAPAQSVHELAEALDRESTSVTIVEGCGHGVPLESPRIWRQSIVEFTEAP